MRTVLIILVVLSLVSIEATKKYEHLHKSNKKFRLMTAAGDVEHDEDEHGTIYPETQEFLDKVRKMKTFQDVENLRDEEGDDFELVDFGKKNGPGADNKKQAQPKPAKCPASKPADAKSSAPDDDVPEAFSDSTDSSRSSESVGDDKPPNDIDDIQATSAPEERQDSSRTARSFTSAVERELQNPSPLPSPPDSDSKKKKKKRRHREEEQQPTPEDLEESYKYEVLPPPDNSAVSLDFPASPAAQGEVHLSKHVPLPLYCDTCMAIAFQLHGSFHKFANQVRSRLPTESEVYHLVSETCRPERFKKYGMLEVAGQRHITGPGCNKLEAEGGVKHSRGPWPKRISERCEELTEDVGETVIHEEWLREGRNPEKLKRFLCFGESPRDYCGRFGYEDGETAAAEHRRQRLLEKQRKEAEEPIDGIRRLERERAAAAEKQMEAERAAAAQARVTDEL